MKEIGTSRTGRISGDELDGLPFISQKDFRPTPYEATTWEEVGERVKDRDFVPLEVSILHGEGEPDPMFDVFDPGFAKEEEALFHGAGTKRPKTFDELEAAQIQTEYIEQLQAEAESRIEEAHKKGFEEGTRKAEAKIMERYEVLSQRLQGITDAILQQWSNQATTLERQALDLSLNIARKIVSTTVDVRPDYILTVIRQALSELGAAKPVRIRVSPQDFEFLNVIGLPVELSAQELGVTYVADETVSSGCIVETDFGEVDIVLERMWEQVRDNIYQTKG